MADLNKLLLERSDKLLSLGEYTYWLIRTGKLDMPEHEKILEELRKLDKEIFKETHELVLEKEEGACPKCKTAIDDPTVSFCGECGLNIDEYYKTEVKHCVKCKGIISVESEYCSICGSKQKEAI